MQNIKIALEVECYNLDFTFKPSFISSTYRQVGKNTWRKINSYLFKNLTIKQKKDTVFITGLVSISKESIEEFVHAETGLWHAPFEYDIHKAPNEFKELLEKLSQLYPGVRIPVSLFEQDKIFAAVCLSKRTDYETFVRHWMEKILKKYGDNILNIIYASKKDLLGIGTSYQIFDLVKTLKSMLMFHSSLEKLPIFIKRYLENKDPIENPFEFLSRKIPPQIARMVLISLVKGIGPKTADSYLLNTSFHTDIVPVDTHLKNVTRRLLLLDDFKVPQSSLCSKYGCTEMVSRKLRIPLCPMSSRCIRSKILELGKLAGWFQTLSYLFGRDYCRKNKPRCDICPLKKICFYFNILRSK